MQTYYEPDLDVDGRVSNRARPNASYAMLLPAGITDRDDESLALGAVSAAKLVPSLVDAILTFKTDTQITLLK
ncbi:MAG: hypothetical protein ABJN98_10540 [Roseibium sp.]